MFCLNQKKKNELNAGQLVTGQESCYLAAMVGYS